MRGLYFLILFILSFVLFYIGNPSGFMPFLGKLFNIAFPLIVVGGFLIYYLNKYDKEKKSKKRK